MFSAPYSDIFIVTVYVTTFTETENPYADEWIVDITCLDYPGLIDDSPIENLPN